MTVNQVERKVLGKNSSLEFVACFEESQEAAADTVPEDAVAPTIVEETKTPPTEEDADEERPPKRSRASDNLDALGDALASPWQCPCPSTCP